MDKRSYLAAELAIKASQASVARIRNSSPRPFGFEPNSSHPMPERVVSAEGPGAIGDVLKGFLGIRAKMCTMILRYGDASDQAATCIEIISDFSRDVQEARPVEDELVRVMERDNAVKLDGDSLEPDLSYLEPGSADVTVQGAHRTVPMVAFGRHCAFQFKAEDILVTVVARKLPADLAGFVRLADLEPLLAGMIGMKDRRDELAAWFEARRGEDGFSP